MAVNKFRNEYFYLSNFSRHSFVDDKGRKWPTVEHFFQAHKTMDASWFKKIRMAQTPKEAKQLGRKCPLRPCWNSIKDDVMRQALKYKFDQNTDIQEKLVSTGDEHLEEGNTWGDTYWGTVYGEGKNMLGKCLMELREQYVGKG